MFAALSDVQALTAEVALTCLVSFASLGKFLKLGLCFLQRQREHWEEVCQCLRSSKIHQTLCKVCLTTQTLRRRQTCMSMGAKRSSRLGQANQPAAECFLHCTPMICRENHSRHALLCTNPYLTRASVALNGKVDASQSLWDGLLLHLRGLQHAHLLKPHLQVTQHICNPSRAPLQAQLDAWQQIWWHERQGRYQYHSGA